MVCLDRIIDDNPLPPLFNHTHVQLLMFNAHILEGQGDEGSVPEPHDAAAQLPRSIAQTSLFNEMDEPIATADQSVSSSSSASQSILLLAVPVDRVKYGYEIDVLLLQMKRFDVDALSTVSISTSLAKKLISHTLLALAHPNPIASTTSILAILEEKNELPYADTTAFFNSILSIHQTKEAFDGARSACSALNWSSLFLDQ